MRAFPAIAVLSCLLSLPSAAAPVHMATGFKITEVDATHATVWTRLTRHADRNRKGDRFGKEDEKLPRGKTLADMIDSAVGSAGEVRVSHRLGGTKAWTRSEWLPVDPQADFIRHVRLTKLQPGGEYELRVAGRPSGATATTAATVQLTGRFRTAPAAAESRAVSFTVISCQDYGRRDDPDNGHNIYPQMLKLDPDFFIHTGDVVYYDKPYPWAKNIGLARYKWQATYSMPFQRKFHRRVSSYFMRDDHDTTRNDSWPGIDYGDLKWEEGLRVFREQTGLSTPPYRTIRWGKDLQVWLPAGREFRSPNRLPDGPDKSIWGRRQKEWLFASVRDSDATFRIIVNSTPIVGPDRSNKNDNHANRRFTHEGNEIRRFVSSQKNMYLVCGDRHWQYVSVDPQTGVTEYSTGPSSNQHAGGWKQDNQTDMHRFLKVKGGFLRVEVRRVDGRPQASFRHYGVNGDLHHEDLKFAR